MNRSNQLNLQWLVSTLNKQPKHVCDGCRCSNWQQDRLDEDGNEEGEAMKGLISSRPSNAKRKKRTQVLLSTHCTSRSSVSDRAEAEGTVADSIGIDWTSVPSY